MQLLVYCTHRTKMRGIKVKIESMFFNSYLLLHLCVLYIVDSVSLVWITLD
jgi:hypothetical protein